LRHFFTIDALIIARVGKKLICTYPWSDILSDISPGIPAEFGGPGGKWETVERT